MLSHFIDDNDKLLQATDAIEQATDAITVLGRSYPTPDAYEAACAALHKHRQRADQAEAELDGLIRDLRSWQEGYKEQAWRRNVAENRAERAKDQLALQNDDISRMMNDLNAARRQLKQVRDEIERLRTEDSKLANWMLELLDLPTNPETRSVVEKAYAAGRADVLYAIRRAWPARADATPVNGDDDD